MENLNRRSFLRISGLSLAGLSLGCNGLNLKPKNQPNILFCIADDWGWPHAGAYGDPVVKTPTFDRIADEGVLFQHAFVSSPSCTPSRNAILTGQYFWRLDQGANLHSTLDVNIPVYPLMLLESGYHVGHWRKCWGPGKLKPGGYMDKNPGGPRYSGFKEFLEQRPQKKPFCFWLGSSDPHRGYEKGSGKASGMDIGKVPVPGFYPDVEEIRSDIADYYFEVQRFDNDCADALRLLKETRELDNTIVIMTGDHGMPFPRCKSNLYDMGARVPLAIMWGKHIKGARRIKDFVSFIDLAPTILELAGLDVPANVTGKSLLPLLVSDKQGWVDNNRKSVIYGRERHTPAQLAPSLDGYPCRAIRTEQYLYIKNFKPDRWPVGVPEGASHPMDQFSDCDNGPTKSFIMEHEKDPDFQQFYQWCFGKRPAEELYEIKNDPDQLINLADKPEYEKIRLSLHDQLIEKLKESGDPRITGGGEKFDQYPYRTDYELRKTIPINDAPR